AGTVAAGDDSRLKSVDGKTGGGVIGHTYFKIIQDILPANGCIVASTTQSSTGITPAQLQMFCQIGSGGQRYGFLRLYQDSSYKDWYMDYSSGNAYAPASWVNNSDRRIKDKITPIDDPLGKMKKVRGYTWVRKDDQMKGSFGIGFVAQEIQEIIPEAVCCSREGSVTVDGEEIENSLALSPGEIAAALHHEAILALMEKIDELTLKVEVLQSGS
ncbi:tail fiber domain-containing protein, partial [Enterobacter roggenkampii]|uniref:tail fiber domain-containing protein n=3 Tax=Enterobacter roggenkampii TaxID=1812935 RepID=UPI001BE001AE